MPLYEYRCDACGQPFEVIQKFSEVSETCRLCGKGPVHRQVSAPGFQFKGTGWDITDYAPKGEAGGDSAGGKAGGGKAGGGKTAAFGTPGAGSVSPSRRFRPPPAHASLQKVEQKQKPKTNFLRIFGRGSYHKHPSPATSGPTPRRRR